MDSFPLYILKIVYKKAWKLSKDLPKPTNSSSSRDAEKEDKPQLQVFMVKTLHSSKVKLFIITTNYYVFNLGLWTRHR